MPRLDRTFSDKDLIRLILGYLTRTEKVAVLEFFGLGLSGPETENPKTVSMAKINKVKVAISSEMATLKAVLGIVGPASKLPGPQQSILVAINKSLDTLLTVLTVIDKLLA